MAKLNEIRTANELGRKGTDKYTWAACKDCGKERWVRIKCQDKVCLSCRSRKMMTPEFRERQSLAMRGRNRGADNPNWRGGRGFRGEYIVLWISPNSPFAPMAVKEGNGKGAHYVSEHRLVMAKYLGRCLEPEEIVHHRNGVKGDNRIENLELTNRYTHMKDHTKGYTDGFELGFQEGYKRGMESMSKSTIDQA